MKSEKKRIKIEKEILRENNSKSFTMCGRTCCTLGPDLVPYACTIVTKDRKLPQWKEAPCGGHYEPSTNVPPTAYTPVLYTTDEVKHGQKQDEDVLSKASSYDFFLFSYKKMECFPKKCINNGQTSKKSLLKSGVRLEPIIIEYIWGLNVIFFMAIIFYLEKIRILLEE